jgi:hypothetical protein
VRRLALAGSRLLGQGAIGGVHPHVLFAENDGPGVAQILAASQEIAA